MTNALMVTEIFPYLAFLTVEGRSISEYGLWKEGALASQPLHCDAVSLPFSVLYTPAGHGFWRRPASQPSNQLTNQPMRQLTSLSVSHHPANQPTDHPASQQPVSQPSRQPTSHPVNQPKAIQPINQSDTQQPIQLHVSAIFLRLCR